MKSFPLPKNAIYIYLLSGNILFPDIIKKGRIINN